MTNETEVMCYRIDLLSSNFGMKMSVRISILYIRTSYDPSRLKQVKIDTLWWVIGLREVRWTKEVEVMLFPGENVPVPGNDEGEKQSKDVGFVNTGGKMWQYGRLIRVVVSKKSQNTVRSKSLRLHCFKENCIRGVDIP